VILAVILFGDSFSAVQAVGGLLILASVVMQAGRTGRAAPDAAGVLP